MFMCMSGERCLHLKSDFLTGFSHKPLMLLWHRRIYLCLYETYLIICDKQHSPVGSWIGSSKPAAHNG